MKKTILGLVWIMIILACDPEDRFLVNRVIKNNSSHQVTLDGYNNGEVDSFLFMPGDSLVDTEECVFKRGILKCDIQSLDYDSVIINYNNERMEIFCSGLFSECINSERNIMEFNVLNDQFRGGYIENPVNTFIYTITNEDYENAEPIGG